MKEQFLSTLGTGLRGFSWSTLLVGIVVVKAVLSLAVTPGSFLFSYSGISYFLLLVLATGFAIRNGIQDTLRSRLFWIFLAVAYGLWMLDQGLTIYYELGLHIEVPDNSIADSVLFLHIVPLMAAVAMFPHRNAAADKVYRGMLNFLFLLSFWGFVFGYTTFPYRLSHATLPTYDTRFDILYFVENLSLVIAAGIFMFRAERPWKSIYFHLFCASSLYTLSSSAANVAIDSGGYVNGKLYGLGLTASVCWFVWIPLRARQLPKSDMTAAPPDSIYGSQASTWAMLAALLITIPIVWELFQRSETAGLSTVRLLVALAAMVCLAGAAYAKEYLAKRELVSQVGFVNDQLRLAMKSGKSVGWDWDIKSGRDTLFGDLKTMFGIPSDTYVAHVEDFHRSVHPDDRGQVSKAVSDAMRRHEPYASEFRILWPDGTVRWIAANGKFYYSRLGRPERMLGMAVDTTELKQADAALREREAELKEAQRLAQVGSWQWERASDTVLWSEELYRMAGRNTNLPAVNFKDHDQLYTPESWEKLRHSAEEALRTGAAYQLELEMVPSGVTRRWVRARGEVQRDMEGSIVGLRGTVQDITERKLAEEALSGLSRRAIEAEEREHNRIAKDLHEDIGQRLALLAIEIEQLKTGAPNQTVEVHSRMDAVWKRTLEILTDVKASAHELHSPRLEYLGLAEVVSCFCKELGERKKIEIDFSGHGLPSLIPPDISICLFRVLQEALFNGMQHSGVRQFEVQLWGTPDEIRLSVSDSGAGFNVEAARKGQGLGLIRMEERLKLVKGTLSIESEAGGGTRIYARAPLGSEINVIRAAS
jgi:PAS domain S-box-containing protein